MTACLLNEACACLLNGPSEYHSKCESDTDRMNRSTTHARAGRGSAIRAEDPRGSTPNRTRRRARRRVTVSRPGVRAGDARDTTTAGGRYLEEFRGGKAGAYRAAKKTLDSGASTIAPLEIPSEDRNRTSPFPYGGHRFEFRAVGYRTSGVGLLRPPSPPRMRVRNLSLLSRPLSLGLSDERRRLVWGF
jgi:hypothetical protein